jgi:hypothetical protein
VGVLAVAQRGDELGGDGAQRRELLLLVHPANQAEIAVS